MWPSSAAAPGRGAPSRSGRRQRGGQPLPRVRVQQQSLATYAAAGPGLFSRVVCNPPFFQRALHSPDAGRSAARHAAPDTLIFAKIVRFSGAFLTADGRLTVLLPMPEITAFAREAGAVGLPRPHDLCCTTGPAAACCARQ